MQLKLKDNQIEKLEKENQHLNNEIYRLMGEIKKDAYNYGVSLNELRNEIKKLNAKKDE